MLGLPLRTGRRYLSKDLNKEDDMKKKKTHILERHEDPTTMELPIQLVDNIVGYLASRPFSEVAGIISDIQMALTLHVKSKSLDKDQPVG